MGGFGHSLRGQLSRASIESPHSLLPLAGTYLTATMGGVVHCPNDLPLAVGFLEAGGGSQRRATVLS